MTEFGPTLEVYRQPATLATARGLSDPPLNWVRVAKIGDLFRHTKSDDPGRAADDIPVPAAYGHLADGPYILAIRPHHLSLSSTGPDDVVLDGLVTATEITGSESFVRMRCLGESIMVTHGIHDFPRGKAIRVHLDLRRLMVFGDDGTAIAPPRAMAA